MLFFGHRYQTQVKMGNEEYLIEITCPSWWTMILRFLLGMFVIGFGLFVWAYFAMVGERQLWLAANSTTSRMLWRSVSLNLISHLCLFFNFDSHTLSTGEAQRKTC
jgi:hypothetical protein